jgi:hypothetical protein
MTTPDPQPDVFQSFVDSLLRRLARALAPYLPPRRPSVIIVPILGPFREQSSAAVPFRHHTRRSSWKGQVLLMFQLGSSQQVLLSVAFRDRRGNPARVDGTPDWLTDNSEVLALEPSGDGLSCLVRALGPLGKATVTLSADADLGEGSLPIVGSFEVEVTAGNATVVELVPGTPEEQGEELDDGLPDETDDGGVV